MGVPYIVQIFYNEVLRGTMDVKTSGFIGSVVLNIPVILQWKISMSSL